MANVVIERQTGTTTIVGTDWPVRDRVERRQYGKRVEWTYVRGLCNGTPARAVSYRTKRQALAAYELDGRLTDEQRQDAVEGGVDYLDEIAES